MNFPPSLKNRFIGLFDPMAEWARRFPDGLNWYLNVYLPVAFPDPPGTLPKPCNAGLIDVEWVIEDFTKNEVQQSWWNVVLRLREVPLQAFSSVPAGSVGAAFFNVKVYVGCEHNRGKTYS